MLTPTTEAAQALAREWGLTISDNITEEAILKALAERVIVLMSKGAEPFFQLMYRLDISEKKLQAVLGTNDVAERIARLIYDRQLQKIASREHFRNSASNDPDLEW